MANFYAFYPPSGGGSTNASVGLNGSPAPASSTEIGFINGSGNQTAVSPSTPLPVAPAAGSITDVNLIEVAGTAVSVGNGASTAGTQRVAVATGSGLALDATLSSFSAKSASAFINSPFDETVITYVGASTNIDTVTYKLLGVTVNTLTMSYDGSNRLIDVVKT